MVAASGRRTGSATVTVAKGRIMLSESPYSDVEFRHGDCHGLMIDSDIRVTMLPVGPLTRYQYQSGFRVSGQF